MEKLLYHIFIAHAAKDTIIAEKIYNILSIKYEIFLDCVSLLPSDLWDIEIPKAQKLSLLSLILISNNINSSYYEQEEIAYAIQLSRIRYDQHRVLPIYLEENKDNNDVPYGLRRINSLYISDNKGLESLIYKIDDLFRIIKPESFGLFEKGENASYWKENNNNIDVHFEDIIKNEDFTKTIVSLAQKAYLDDFPLYLIYLDLDGFTNINLKYGNECADTILDTIDNIIAENTINNYHQRLGGDEFAIVIADCDYAEVYKIALKIRASIKKYNWSTLSLGLFLTGSFGISEIDYIKNRSQSDQTYINSSLFKDSVDAWFIKAVCGSIFSKKDGGNAINKGPIYLPDGYRNLFYLKS